MKLSFCWTSTKSFLSLGLLLVLSTWGAAMWIRSQPPNRQAVQPDAATKARLNELYGQLPLSFEANVGQSHPRVDFISRGSGYSLFLTPGEAVLALPATELHMKFVGSEAQPRAIGQKELPGKVNYVVGNDPKQWRTGIATYG